MTDKDTLTWLEQAINDPLYPTNRKVRKEQAVKLLEKAKQPGGILEDIGRLEQEVKDTEAKRQKQLNINTILLEFLKKDLGWNNIAEAKTALGGQTFAQIIKERDEAKAETAKKEAEWQTKWDEREKQRNETIQDLNNDLTILNGHHKKLKGEKKQQDKELNDIYSTYSVDPQTIAAIKHGISATIQARNKMEQERDQVRAERDDLQDEVDEHVQKEKDGKEVFEVICQRINKKKTFIFGDINKNKIHRDLDKLKTYFGWDDIKTDWEDDSDAEIIEPETPTKPKKEKKPKKPVEQDEGLSDEEDDTASTSKKVNWLKTSKRIRKWIQNTFENVKITGFTNTWKDPETDFNNYGSGTAGQMNDHWRNNKTWDKYLNTASEQGTDSEKDVLFIFSNLIYPLTEVIVDKLSEAGTKKAAQKLKAFIDDTHTNHNSAKAILNSEPWKGKVAKLLAKLN